MYKRNKSIWIYGLVCCIGVVSLVFAGQGGSQPPAYVPASSIHDNNGAPPLGPSNALLTAEQVEQLKQSIASMPPFPRYLYSGCHDRAHAAFLLLPDPLQSRADKIWLFPPSRFTSAIQGNIRLNSKGKMEEQVEWGYHVGLIFNTAMGDVVYDPALSPKNLLTTAEWFAMMNIRKRNPKHLLTVIGWS